MSIELLGTMLRRGAKAHLVGIGGVSMAPLADALLKRDISVTGSDEKDGENTQRLIKRGVPVKIGHAAEHVRSAELVIRTAAAHDDNVEIMEARRLGIPVFERAAAWGFISSGYKNAVCVAGAHGKTTTTAMIAQILLEADVDPTVMIGGTLPALGSGCRVGDTEEFIVMEACEFNDSFLSFSPTVAVILNVDAEHLDYFGSLEGVKDSFRNFALSVRGGDGRIVLNGGDANTMDVRRGLGSRNTMTFGFSEVHDVRGVDYTQDGARTRFDVMRGEKVFCRLNMLVPGRHNAENALAACAAASALGIPGAVIEAALNKFTGAARRFEFKGKVSGADIYDDYAHHPNELKALLDMVETLDYNRVLLAFQPHTYTRTHQHFGAFIEQLRRPDMLYLADIYAAREKNTIGITSRDLAVKIPGAEYVPDFKEMERRIASVAAPGDLILTVGAGELYKVGEGLADIKDIE